MEELEVEEFAWMLQVLLTDMSRWRSRYAVSQETRKSDRDSERDDKKVGP